MTPQYRAKGLAHLVRSVALVVVAGSALVPLSGAVASGNVQIAAASSSPASIESCITSQAPPAAIVEACTKLLESKELLGADRAAALYHRGLAYGAMGDGAKARSDLLASANQYTALMPISNPPVALLYARAVVWHSLGDADRAIADYDQVARMAPTEPLVFLNRGILLARYKQQYRLALMDFDRVLELKPKDPEVAYRAAQERAVAMAAISSPGVQDRKNGDTGLP